MLRKRHTELRRRHAAKAAHRATHTHTRCTGPFDRLTAVWAGMGYRITPPTDRKIYIRPGMYRTSKYINLSIVSLFAKKDKVCYIDCGAKQNFN